MPSALDNIKREWITDAPGPAGFYVVGWLFTDKEAGRNTLLALLTELADANARLEALDDIGAERGFKE